MRVIRTDFSNPAKPKTKIRTTYLKNSKKVFVLDTITYGTYAEYGKYTAMDDAALVGGPLAKSYQNAIGKWVRLESKDEAVVFDPTNSAGRVKMTQGEMLVGNYPAPVRQELVEAYKTKKVLSFDPKQVKTETISGKKAFKYLIKVNTRALEDVNHVAEKNLACRRHTRIIRLRATHSPYGLIYLISAHYVSSVKIMVLRVSWTLLTQIRLKFQHQRQIIQCRACSS